MDRSDEHSARANAENTAMLRALQIAASNGVPYGPNPRVGCVLLRPDGTTIAEGCHRGAGTPHAEIDALTQAGAAARGATAVVTLEPCNHTGRTGPCSQALRAAGVARVVYAQADPNPIAAGGAAALRSAGVDVERGPFAEQAQALNEYWTFAVTHGRPYVTWKVAASLDGRVAAPDGTSRWISGPDSRAQAHELRAQVDAILVGTGTALTDDPALTVRDADGHPAQRQPLRVVVGHRPIPPGARLLDGSAPTLTLATHDPAQVLSTLAEREVRHVLLEGGPTLAGGFCAAGLVDEVRWYVAPMLLGAGLAALTGTGLETLTGAWRLSVVGVSQVGADVRIDLRPHSNVSAAETFTTTQSPRSS